MGLIKAITTPGGSTLNYWEFKMVDLLVSTPEKANQSCNVQIDGYHTKQYYEDGNGPIKSHRYLNNMVSGTDLYSYEDLTGVSGQVTGTKRLGPALPNDWSWTENSVSGWMADSSDMRNGAQTWVLNCVPDFSGATVDGTYPD